MLGEGIRLEGEEGGAHGHGHRKDDECAHGEPSPKPGFRRRRIVCPNADLRVGVATRGFGHVLISDRATPQEGCSGNGMAI
jgi:hypothetical protein